MIICNTRITFGTLGNDSEYQWGLLYVLCCAQANVPSRGRGVKSEVGILEFKYAINPVIDLAQDFERWDVEIHLYAFQRFVDKNIFGLIWFVTKCLIGHWLLHLPTVHIFQVFLWFLISEEKWETKIKCLAYLLQVIECRRLLQVIYQIMLKNLTKVNSCVKFKSIFHKMCQKDNIILLAIHHVSWNFINCCLLIFLSKINSFQVTCAKSYSSSFRHIYDIA